MYVCMFVLHLGRQLRFLGSNHQPCALTFTQITWETQRALGNIIGDPAWVVTEVSSYVWISIGIYMYMYIYMGILPTSKHQYQYHHEYIYIHMGLLMVNLSHLLTVI